MTDTSRTLTVESSPSPPGGTAAPGLLVFFAGTQPAWHVVGAQQDRLQIGRGLLEELGLRDRGVSRAHAEFAFEGGAWSVRDCESHNGTFVDGRRIERGERVSCGSSVVRLGNTLVLPVTDACGFHAIVSPREPERVAGPALRDAFARIAHAARASQTLLVTGESGTGKELAARSFHALGPHSRGPHVVVNCAAIPAPVAERLLFGAVRGAYSGAAADTAGYVQSADGGVLFLDEVGELDLDVQAKLLRVVETQEVAMLGSTHARRVRVRFTFATHRDLRERVAEKRFRADLYFRIANPEVRLPPLRERREEIPWHVASELEQVGPALRAHVKLVERCAILPWPGNVRELRRAVRDAAQRAVGDDPRSTIVTEEHLPAAAGHEVVGEASLQAPLADLGAEQVASALQKAGGNVAAAARTLGLHRTQLYRLIERWNLRPK